MVILTEKMGIVEAEIFLFLVKTEGFDYTKWQRDYYGNKCKEMDVDMDAFLISHPSSCNTARCESLKNGISHPLIDKMERLTRWITKLCSTGIFAALHFDEMACAF